MPGPDLITSLISSSGTIIGTTLLGFVYIPYNQGGILMQDSSGALWLLQINTDGSLSTSQVTI